MVRRDRVDDDRGLAVTLDEVGADARVAALHLARDRLADVVEEAGALGHVGVEPDLARDQRREERRLDRVVEHVLVVGEPVPELAEQLDDLRVEAVDVELGDGVLAGLGRRKVDLVLRPLHVLLDAGRMDAPVLDQGLERVARDLAAHGVEGRQEDKLGRLVDQERDAGRRLEGLDVAALPADEPALHVLARQVDERRRQVGVGLARQPLHRGDQDAARLRLKLLLGLLERVAPHRAQLVLALEEHLLAQLLADLLAVELRHALEPLADVLGEVADRVARLPDGAALAVEPLLALLQLEVEERQGLLVGADLPQPDIGLDLAPVEFAVELGPLLLDLRLGLLPDLLGRHRRLAARHLDQLRGLLMGHPPGVSGHQPDDNEPDKPPEEEGKRERRVSQSAWQSGCYFGYGC